ncbi:chemotaxis protein CheX [Cohnella faecalis]|uniref:chemotaxis protein CheX n=1 Tax=Cohnella faecalis TaxID=2315694 RepID=UPI0013143D2A|nr:chemotaxis protein CheX [Cohnella faecalis]
MEPNYEAGDPDLFPGLLSSAEQYLGTLGIGELKRISTEQGSDGLPLEDVTAFIQVSGSLQGGFLFSADHSLSRELARKFMIEEITDLEAAQYAVETVAEVANVITAASLNSREETGIYLGNPLMILSRDMGVRAGRYETQAYETPSGRCRFFYIPKMEKAELASIVTV